MTALQPPLVETRTESGIAAEVADRARIRLDGSDPMGEGLVRVFARYFGIVADRLNRVPDQHRRAFLGYLGIRPVLPTAARVPLTFTPIGQLAQRSEGSTADRAYVPMRTRVAAEAIDGSGEPVVFETEQPLDLTGAVIDRIVALDAHSDRVGDYPEVAIKAVPPASIFATGMRPARHDLVLEAPVHWPPETVGITIHFGIDAGTDNVRSVQWALAGDELDRGRDRSLVPTLDTTVALTQSGKVRLAGLSEWPRSRIAGRDGRFLRCSVAADAATDERSHATIRQVAMSARFQVSDEAPASASFNAQPLDLSTGFFPLGHAPRFGDACYLQSRLFAVEDADIAVQFDVANPLVDATPEDVQAHRPAHTRLTWECARDGRWIPLSCEDTTYGLTRSGAVFFHVPTGGSIISVNGVDGGWIRARLAKASNPSTGDTRIVADPTAPPAPAAATGAGVFVPAIEHIRIDASKAYPRTPVEQIIVVDDFETAVRPVSRATPLDPIARRIHDRTGLYLRLAGGVEALAERTLSLYAFVDEGGVASAGKAAIATGECFTGQAWSSSGFVDETDGLSRSGAIRIDLPAFDVPTVRPAAASTWIRLRWSADGVPTRALVERLALNTVAAIHGSTYENELLGSGTGHSHQALRCARTPVLDVFELDVREPDLFGGRGGVHALPGADDRVFTTGHVERPETWIRWGRVADFFDSGPDDRHFVLDSMTGVIGFGDGARGKTPPPGANNIRIHRYRAGGGARGNVPAGAINALRTTVRYVTGVVNPVAAAGGADVEPVDHCIARGSAWLRHRDRAVTRQDYEDLAMAMPQVARARCLPLRALDRDPDASRVEVGCVSMVIVPPGAEASPVPTAAQLRNVQAFLDARKAPAVRLTVAAVEYVRVDVDAELSCAVGEDPVTLAERCRVRLDAWLHPLTGGSDGKGWSFAERPTMGALDTFLRRLDGVEQVDRSSMRFRESRSRVASTGHYLICAGTHQVRCIRQKLVEARRA